MLLKLTLDMEALVPNVPQCVSARATQKPVRVFALDITAKTQAQRPKHVIGVVVSGSIADK
jgi:hypothetical protein